MYKMIDFEYFGYRDEEDNSLLKIEARAEKRGPLPACVRVRLHVDV